MGTSKLVAKCALWGAIGGVALGIFLITLDQLRIFPWSWGGFIDRATLSLCPLYVLGFSIDVKSMTSLVLITLIGNAFLYGALTALVAGAVALFRRSEH